MELGLLGDGAALREERGSGGYSLERGVADLFRVRVFRWMRVASFFVFY